MPFILPPTLPSKQDAVNVLLQAIGEAPVNSIEVSESVDVAAAVQALDEISLAVQTKGWHWNREYGLKLTPNSQNQLVLPDNTLRVVKAYDEAPQLPRKVAQRGARLYDQQNHTFTFDDPLLVDLILFLAYEDIPAYAARYITIRAAMQFQGRLQTNSSVTRITEDEVAQAVAIVEQAEDEAQTNNGINNNTEVYSRVHGRARRRTR
jgi:Tail tubular protein